MPAPLAIAPPYVCECKYREKKRLSPPSFLPLLFVPSLSPPPSSSPSRHGFFSRALRLLLVFDRVRRFISLAAECCCGVLVVVVALCVHGERHRYFVCLLRALHIHVSTYSAV